MTRVPDSSTRAARRAALGLGLLLVAGCGDGSGPPADADAGMLFSCATEARALPYAPNLARSSDSGAFTVRLVSSDPAPPARGTETWTVAVVDQSGAPQDGLAIKVTPFMPDHNHGTSVKAAVTAAGAGTYTMSPLYLYMAGYWEVTLNLQTAGGTKDSVMFPVCIPG